MILSLSSTYRSLTCYLGYLEKDACLLQEADGVVEMVVKVLHQLWEEASSADVRKQAGRIGQAYLRRDCEYIGELDLSCWLDKGGDYTVPEVVQSHVWNHEFLDELLGQPQDVVEADQLELLAEIPLGGRHGIISINRQSTLHGAKHHRKYLVADQPQYQQLLAVVQQALDDIEYSNEIRVLLQGALPQFCLLK